jgi:hypothetical protein
MADSLTEEQRTLVLAQARNSAAAQALLGLLQSTGMNAPAMLGALATAFTALIETSYDPPHRLTIMNALLADTINEFATAAAVAEGAGVTRQ